MVIWCRYLVHFEKVEGRGLSMEIVKRIGIGMGKEDWDCCCLVGVNGRCAKRCRVRFVEEAAGCRLQVAGCRLKNQRSGEDERVES